jgi:hypothetical protein
MNNELWQLALNDDCFKYRNCQDCAIITGCGWCKLNDVGFQVLRHFVSYFLFTVFFNYLKIE